LTAATLNLVNELFGREQAVAPFGAVDGGVAVAGLSPASVPAELSSRATLFFLWMAALIGLIALIGFIPAIGVFIFAYMCFGFGETWIDAAGYAVATTLVCWGVFDRALHVAWPHSLLGNLVPALRAGIGLI